MLIVLVVVAGVLAGCSDDDGSASGSGKPVIAVTIVPLASLTQQIVGDAAEVVTLIPAGISPHGYEPTAQQIDALQSAGIVIYNGAGYDDWAGAAAKRRGDDVTVLSLAGLVGIEAPAHEHEHGHHDQQEKKSHAEHDHGHASGGVNPHLWVDPVLTLKFVKELGYELAEHLPQAADQIQLNTDTLLEDLAGIEDEYAEALSPHAGKPIITFHNAFDPMAERFGLKVALTLMPNDAIGATLTPGRLDEAIRLIRDNNIKAIYSEPQFPADIAAPIVETTGVKVLVLDPLGDPNAPGRDTYQAMMRHNLQKLVEGLSIQ